MPFDSIRELLSRDTKSKPTKRQKDLAQGLIGNLGPRRTWAVYIPFLEIESFDPIHDICRVLLDQISFSGDILCLMKDKICFVLRYKSGRYTLAKRFPLLAGYPSVLLRLEWNLDKVSLVPRHLSHLLSTMGHFCKPPRLCECPQI